MKEWFVKLGYPEAVIEKEMKKICFSKQGKTSKKVEKGVPFVVTYHPLLNKLTSIIYRNFYMLYINQEVKNFFTLGPIEMLLRLVVTLEERMLLKSLV